MEIRAWFKGIKVEETDDLGLLDGQRSKPTDMTEPGNKIYALSGTGWQGFLIGGVVRFKEDDGEIFCPSARVGEPLCDRWTLG